MNKLKYILSLLIIITLVGGNSIPVFAQDDVVIDVKCVDEMKPFMATKSAEMRAYINEHFQNKSTNSSLLELAVKRFDKYKRDLLEKYQSYAPQEGLSILSESYDVLRCETIVNEEIAIMEKLIKSFFEKSSKVKTSSAHLQKLKAINKKLDELMKTIVQMYGKWLTFKGRVPCLAKKCI